MKFVVLAVAGMTIACSVLGGEVKLTWDLNPPQDQVEAYIVYEHNDKSYTPVSFVRTNLAVLTNVLAGDHCYVVTASNRWGESPFSNEACTHVRVPDDLNDPGSATNFIYTAAVGRSTLITNLALAFSTEVPPPYRLYSLCDGDPFGRVKINPTNGIVSWKPGRETAGTTNTFTVCLTDVRSSLQSATRQFQVVVQDYAGAWLGSNTVFDLGQTTVPLTVYSSKPLMDFYLVLETTSGCVTNVAFVPQSGQSCVSFFEPISANQWMIAATGCNDNPFLQEVAIGHLQFQVTAGESCFLPLRMREVMAFQSDGSPFEVAAGHNGRIVVIGRQPLLEMTVGEEGRKSLNLYGHPGSILQVDFSYTSPMPSAWLPAWQVAMTGMHHVIDGSLWKVPRAFFRVKELTPAP